MNKMPAKTFIKFDIQISNIERIPASMFNYLELRLKCSKRKVTFELPLSLSNVSKLQAGIIRMAVGMGPT